MSDASAPSGNAPAGDAPKKERKLLYYRNPMKPTAPRQRPRKDPMGMDYIAVYEGEEEDSSSVDPTEIQHRKNPETRRQD